jgi:hypothetical protein
MFTCFPVCFGEGPNTTRDGWIKSYDPAELYELFLEAMRSCA